MGQTQTIFLPPWVPSTEAEKVNEAEFREAIVKLSAAAANLIAPHPLHEDPEFNFDWVEHRPFAEAAYRGDKRLHRLLPKLVPKRCARQARAARSASACADAARRARPFLCLRSISEEEFWRNYFSRAPRELDQ